MVNLNIKDMIKALEFSYDYVKDVQDKRKYNNIISEYFYRLSADTDDLRMRDIAWSVAHCNEMWGGEMHSKLGVFDVIRINLCRSRYCANCAKMIQASRLNRFTPFLNIAGQTHDLYHTTFTVPNIPGEKLSTQIDIMFKAFTTLIRYLKCDAKLKGVDLSVLGYIAAVRSLEVTYNTLHNDYHPHLHVIFALKKDLNLPKLCRNKFSYDYSCGQPVWKQDFSKLEIFFQKLWRALIDRITANTYSFKNAVGRYYTAKPLNSSAAEQSLFSDNSMSRTGKQNAVTLQTLQALDIGYSCTMDMVDTKCYEAFKYAFKLVDENSATMSYKQFTTLYYALKGRKTIQGYGDWFALTSTDGIDDSVAEFYEVLRAYMRQVDPPTLENKTIDEVVTMIEEKQTRVISPRAIQHILNDLATDDKKVDISELMAYKTELLPPEEDGYKPKRKYDSVDYAAAYLRYMELKRTSPLFADIRRKESELYYKPQIELTALQLDYFGQILY